MSLDGQFIPWQGTAFRHVPEGRNVLDFRYAGQGANNRWNFPGERTLYLAGDEAVAVVEFARHINVDRSRQLASHGQFQPRVLYALDLLLDRLLDLRDPVVCVAISLPNAPLCFLQKPIARATAHYLRVVSEAEGLLVPSVEFPDPGDRPAYKLVLFLDKLPTDVMTFITGVREVGRVGLWPPVRTVEPG